MTTNKETETKPCTIHFVGRTFFALYQSERGTMHDRMLFAEKGGDERMFFNWVQSEREKIEKANDTNCVVLRCSII